MAFQDERNSLSLGAYNAMFGLSPGRRLFAGAAAICAGVGLTVFLWGEGVIWGLTIFAIVAGGFLVLSGALDLRRQRAYQLRVAHVLEHEAEILADMRAAKSRGENVVRWLASQGYLDGQIRGYLLKRAEESGT